MIYQRSKILVIFFMVLDALPHPIPCCASVPYLQNFYLMPVDDLSGIVSGDSFPL